MEKEEIELVFKKMGLPNEEEQSLHRDIIEPEIKEPFYIILENNTERSPEES